MSTTTKEELETNQRGYFSTELKPVEVPLGTILLTICRAAAEATIVISPFVLGAQLSNDSFPLIFQAIFSAAAAAAVYGDLRIQNRSEK